MRLKINFYLLELILGSDLLIGSDRGTEQVTEEHSLIVGGNL
jgi:hypothetical protein